MGCVSSNPSNDPTNKAAKETETASANTTTSVGKTATGTSPVRQDESGVSENEVPPPGAPTASASPPRNGAGRQTGDAVAETSPPTVASSARASLGGTALDPGMFITHQTAHLSDRYIRERKLGSGAYGEVLFCRDKATGAERAIKIIKKSSAAESTTASSLLEEVAVVKQLDHPNIMKLYEFFEDKRNYYLVMEVYAGGELFDEIIERQKFSEADAAFILKQVLSGVCYLHKHRIVHRDLKPENLLLESKGTDALIKIVDFGLSAHFDPSTKMNDRIGTAYYIAPEVLRKKYDEKCDIWAIGVILYILLCGYPPFGGSTDQEILRKVERGKYAFDPPEWTKVSDEAKDLIRAMLIYDPLKRISAEEALRHPWILLASDPNRGAPDAPALLNALGNMRQFYGGQKLAQAALLFMGSKLTTLEETKELTEIFRSLDTNGDGQLDRKELIEGYNQLMKHRHEDDLSPAQVEIEVDRILASVDFDQSGFIEYSEFVTVAMDREVLVSRERLQAAFAMFDKDGSGKIAVEELRKIIKDVSNDQWKEILKDVDRNGDGEVDLEEFVEMMQRLIGK